MLDNLLLAYRSQIYEWDITKWKDFCKKNKKLVTGLGVFILMIVISFVAFIKLKSTILTPIILICELIAMIFLDRYAVKQYRLFLVNRHYHLDKTVGLFKTTLSRKNLFSVEHIDELTERLTSYIESKKPFKGLLTKLSDFTTVAGWAIVVVLLLGFTYFVLDHIFFFLRTITCRNYDAAIALREDLLDIKLLYFIGDKT